MPIFDRKAFDPVLTASPDDYKNERDKEKLRDVQETTRHTQQSYHEKYTSARAVHANFRDDLTSDAAKKVHRTLKDLGLPTLDDIKGEFEQLAGELDIGR